VQSRFQTTERRRWHTEEAREIAASRSLTDPELAVRLHARDLLTHAGVTSVPIKLPLMFPWAGIRKVRPEPMLMEGALRRTAAGTFDVLVREDRAANRQRFSIAHELGHILFYRFAQRAKENQEKCAARAPDEEERLCNIAAEEFLMPEWYVQRLVKEHEGRSLDCLMALAQNCQVSVEASLIRLAPYWLSNGALQLWEGDGREWKLKLARRTGQTRISLDDFETEAWPGKFMDELVKRLPWNSTGWLSSRRKREVVRAATIAIRVPSRIPCVLIAHMLLPAVDTSSGMHTGNELERARCERARRALARAPRRDCTECKGSGWVEEPGPRPITSRVCRCRHRQVA
jgi:hypothetical protein